MSGFDRFVDAFFNYDVAVQYFPRIASSISITINLALLVILAGTTLGLFLAIVRTTQFRPLVLLIIAFADIMRSLPPLVLIILIYFAFPHLNLSMSAFTGTWLALSLVLAAFAEEIFWAGIKAVHKGQSEAARSSGMTQFQTLQYVILPQAVRMTVAPLTNRMIAITKNSALGSVVALPEVLNQASSSASIAGNATPLVIGAAIYLVMFLPVVILSRSLEKHFAWRS